LLRQARKREREQTMSDTTPERGNTILCVGQIVADVVIRPVDKLPVPGRLDVLGDMQLVPGGCACNTAAVLAKLGAPTRIAGLVGNDAFGQAIISMVEGFGVDTRLVQRTSEVPTSSVVVVVAGDGQRSFLYHPGTNEKLTNAAVPKEAFESCSIVHVGGAMKLLGLDMAALFRDAKDAGCITSLDTDWDPTNHWLKLIESALPYVDYLITNEEEGEGLTGAKGAEAISKALLDKGAANVVVKMGAAGSARACPHRFCRIPAFPVEVVDTTCAGDGFVAGFLFAVAAGLPPADCMVLGNATGGLCATQLSHFGVKSMEDTLEYIRAHREVCPDFELL
jgi:sugar/nucleoside kinase (ribokinase family)